MFKLVARISKFFGPLLIIFKVTTKLFWWSNKIIFRSVFKQNFSKIIFLCTIIATYRSRLRWILNASIWETEFREVSFRIREHNISYQRTYHVTIRKDSRSKRSRFHYYPITDIPVWSRKGRKATRYIGEQAESRFWSRRGCGESLHLVIEENRLFLRVMIVSRSRKISVIAQKYTRYCYPKLFYDRFSILLTIWTIKTKKIFYQAAETIRYLNNRN